MNIFYMNSMPLKEKYENGKKNLLKIALDNQNFRFYEYDWIQHHKLSHFF